MIEPSHEPGSHSRQIPQRHGSAIVNPVAGKSDMDDEKRNRKGGRGGGARNAGDVHRGDAVNRDG